MLIADNDLGPPSITVYSEGRVPEPWTMKMFLEEILQ